MLGFRAKQNIHWWWTGEWASEGVTYQCLAVFFWLFLWTFPLSNFVRKWRLKGLVRQRSKYLVVWVQRMVVTAKLGHKLDQKISWPHVLKICATGQNCKNLGWIYIKYSVVTKQVFVFSAYYDVGNIIF